MMFFVALAVISASSRRRISTQFLSDPTLPLKMGTLLQLIISTCITKMIKHWTRLAGNLNQIITELQCGQGKTARWRTLRSRVTQDAENSCFALTLMANTPPSIRTCQNRAAWRMGFNGYYAARPNGSLRLCVSYATACLRDSTKPRQCKISPCKIAGTCFKGYVQNANLVPSTKLQSHICFGTDAVRVERNVNVPS